MALCSRWSRIFNSALELEPGHHFFNVGSGQGYSVIEIANKIAREFEWDGI